MSLLITIYAFIFGSFIGSFLNVVIYRVPRKLDLVLARSKCTKCDYQLTWYDNIPIISYIFLRGKCKKCKSKISLRYPFVEIIVGLLAMMLVPHEFIPEAIFISTVYFYIGCILTAHFFIDIEHKLLPDILNIFLLAAVLPYVIFSKPLTFWLVGGAIGFLGTLAITWLFYKYKGQVGLGGGDIKLFGILGLILGPIGILNNLFLSCFLGALVGIVLIATKKMDKKSPMAFGPFIIAVAIIQIFFPALLHYIPFLTL